MHKNTHYIVVLLVFWFWTSSLSFGQEIITSLPSALNESSALIKYEDLFLTINDSGNKPEVYAFDKEGRIKKVISLKNAQNIDWEAMAFDGEKYLYIGDIGNNLNNRKELIIYKIDLIKSFKSEEPVLAEEIRFSYPEQNDFPPKSSQLYYDAEAMIVKEGEIFVFTKNRTVPFDGLVKVYKLPIKSGNYKAKLVDELQLLKTDWRLDSVTDATFGNNQLFLLTYTKIYVFDMLKEGWKQTKIIEFDNITQKEGITVDGKVLYVTDEKGFFEHNYLYKIHLK